MKVDTILVPTDFSEDAARAVATAADLARKFGARLVLLHAYRFELPIAAPGIPGGVSVPASFYDEVREHAGDRVEALAKEVSEAGVDAIGEAVLGPASVAIVEEAERLRADLVVMGTRGMSGLRHVVLGSVAERVVRSAPCPVMTVKSQT